jgi:hypothetical protein
MGPKLPQYRRRHIPHILNTHTRTHVRIHIHTCAPDLVLHCPTGKVKSNHESRILTFRIFFFLASALSCGKACGSLSSETLASTYVERDNVIQHVARE